MPTLIRSVQDFDRLQGPSRTSGSGGGSVGEKIWIGDKVDRPAEFVRLVGALPDKPQEVDAVADLGRAADGFIMGLGRCPRPGSLEDFIEHVVPLLQRKGIFRTEYREDTVRERFNAPARPAAAAFATVE